jgi:hypothetical protein
MITNTLPIVFMPRGTATITATTSASAATLATPGVGTNVMVYNAGPDLAFVSLGPAGTTATTPTTAGTGSTPVAVGFYGLTLARDANVDLTASAISLGTSAVYFTVGNGT